MRFVDVKRIALYYKAIPGMLHLLRQERAELEEEYNGLGSTAADGTPHGSSPGKPTEELGLRALENGTGERLAQIAEQERVLLEDQAVIRACLDGLNSKYKQLVLMRYVRGYSWAKIGVRLGTPDSTARSWHERAMERLGEALEEYAANPTDTVPGGGAGSTGAYGPRLARAYIISGEKILPGNQGERNGPLPSPAAGFRRSGRAGKAL